MNMDLKRFDEISGREAANRLIDGLDVYSSGGNRYYIEDQKVWMESGNLAGTIGLTISETLRTSWYVKKPFDVRAEMLARPNEWVGAYHDHSSKWIQVGFDAVNMRTKKSYYGYTGSVEGASTESPTAYELETCIPIEDVPEEELT